MQDTAIVKIKYTGTRFLDLYLTEETLKRQIEEPNWSRPRGWVWHHDADGETVMLIPAEVHGSLPHTGGFTLNPVEPSLSNVCKTKASELIISGFPALPESRLKEFERQLGQGLPPQYRAFLIAHNGGTPVPATYFNARSNQIEFVDAFHGIHDDELDTLLSYIEMYLDRLPKSLLPIAHDPFGNLICLSVTGNNQGSVFFWDHETEPATEGMPPNNENTTLIASTFGEFLESFVEVTVDRPN